MDPEFVDFPSQGLLIPSRGTLILSFLPEALRSGTALEIYDELRGGSFKRIIPVHHPTMRIWHPSDRPDHLCIAAPDRRVEITGFATDSQTDANHILRACVKIQLSADSPKIQLSYRVLFHHEDDREYWLKAEADRPEASTFERTCESSQVSSGRGWQGSSGTESV